MSDVLVPQAAKRSILEKLAAKYGMEAAPLQRTLAKTIFPDSRKYGEATPEQVAALCIVADQYDLNPFVKQIYAFPDGKGGIVPVVSVDGWFKIINSHEEFDGLEVALEDDRATCTIHRKDRTHPTVITEYLDECKRNTPAWSQSPRRMLRHRAIAQCARVAFGFAVMEHDEAASVYEREAAAEVVSTKRQRITLDEAVSRISEKEEGPKPPESLAYKEPTHEEELGWGDKTRPMRTFTDEEHDEHIPWTTGAPHGGYPYDVSTETPFVLWSDGVIGGRLKALKELYWRDVKHGSEAYHALRSCVAGSYARDSQTEMERQAAIWCRVLDEEARTNDLDLDLNFGGEDGGEDS